jgi:uncharacterized protein GlcG (DUF336 family)
MRTTWLAPVVAAVLAVSVGRQEAQAIAALSPGEVGQIISQAVQEATARGRPATIAVVDRAGNVLGVFRMNGANNPDADPTLRDISIVNNPNGPNMGLNGLTIIPDTMAAIAKAITGAYLSSSGHAFTTRTASQIVQDHFDPGIAHTPSGPLFGVQFSQLPCSDFSRRMSDGPLVPQRSPLGLAADPGGLPLYKNGEVVGGIGVIADALYGYDANIFDRDSDIDELIAVAGEFNFAPATNIQADHVTAGGQTLRFSDARPGDLATSPPNAPPFDAINNVAGAFVTVPGYYDSGRGPIGGVGYGTTSSGIRPDVSGIYDAVTPPAVLVDLSDNLRFPVRGGSSVGGAADLTAQEVQLILRAAYQVALRTRAQIRVPIGALARINVTVVDTNGTILGLVSSQDAPVFGLDVSVQKARTTVFLSSPLARIQLASNPTLDFYLQQARAYFGPNALDGGIAFSARATGNLARNSYPDGIEGTMNGPFSLPPNLATVFATGLQLDLVAANIVQHVLFIRSPTTQPDTAVGCTGLPATANGKPLLADGLQIFPGGFPIYRGSTLIGAIGVSGDGVDQDDLVAFLGLSNGGRDAGTGVGHAPPAMRSDQLTPFGVRLRYVSCPFGAFVGQNSSDLCNGL